MNVQLTIRNFAVDSRARETITRRVEAALRRLGPRVRSVEIRLVDLNGPGKGGVDKRCQLEVRLDDGSIHVGEGQAPRPLDAVDEACDRVSGALKHHLGRGRSARRERRPHLRLVAASEPASPGPQGAA